MIMGSSDLQLFETYRRLMFSIAYRMLGSAAEAEDILQEAFLRYQAVPTREILSPKAFLSTVVTRLCLNQLRFGPPCNATPILAHGSPNLF